MRCPECAYELGELQPGHPCPECGVVSAPEDRLPRSPIRKGRVFAGYGLTPLLAGALGAIAGFGLGAGGQGAANLMGFLYFTALIGGAIIAAITAFVTTRRLMRRLPRRVASAPLLLLIPRNVLVPLMAACATGAIAATLATGACVAGGISGIR